MKLVQRIAIVAFTLTLSACGGPESQEPDAASGGGSETDTETSTGGELPIGSGGLSSTGSTSSGGSSFATGGGGTGADGHEPAECEFVIDTPASEGRNTVVAVEWSVDLPSLDSATIEYQCADGFCENAPEYAAPVNLQAPNFRTLLLGMKPGKEYTFQIVARGDHRLCKSEPLRVGPGYLRAGLPAIHVSPEDAALSGLTVACSFVAPGLSAGTGAHAYIFDAYGDVVWNHYVSSWGDCAAARMSLDGNHMWLANDNLQSSLGTLVRVGMDGEDVDEFSIPDRHGDIAVLDDGKIAYIEYEGGDPNACDVIKEFDSTTQTSRTIYSIKDADPSGVQQYPCRSNAINYWPEHALYTVSVLNWGRIVAVDRSGTLQWVLGSDAVSGATWQGQHDHHLFGNHLLLLTQDPDAGQVLELELNSTGSSAALVWEHSGTYPAQAFGGVQRLADGNTLVTYGAVGIMQEIASDGQIVKTIESSSAFGSTTRRATLYGPPPPYTQ